MMTSPERRTPFDDSLLKAAAIEGAKRSRSTRQQLEHWVRLGAALSAQPEHRRTGSDAPLDGTFAQRDLSDDEASEFDAEVARRIDGAVSRADFSCTVLRLNVAYTRQVTATDGPTGVVGDARELLREPAASLLAVDAWAARAAIPAWQGHRS